MRSRRYRFEDRNYFPGEAASDIPLRIANKANDPVLIAYTVKDRSASQSAFGLLTSNWPCCRVFARGRSRRPREAAAETSRLSWISEEDAHAVSAIPIKLRDRR